MDQSWNDMGRGRLVLVPATLSTTDPTWTTLHWTRASVVRIRLLSRHGPQYLVDLFQPIHLYIKTRRYSTICIVFWYTNSFYVYGSVHRWSILITVQRDATQSSLFIIRQVHSTCFGCQAHQSSRVGQLLILIHLFTHFECHCTS